jgi:hypothetical protein
MRRIIFLLVLLCPFLAWSQTGNYRARVLDAGTKEPIEFATVTLKQSNNAASLKGGKTNAKGQVSIENIPTGNYELSISSIGFESITNKSVSIQAGTNEGGTFQLKTTTRNLKDVTIKGEKASMEMSVDKKTFNVDKNITSVVKRM